jgi:serine/threonine-protein kinase
VGSHLGKEYWILDRLGDGGMGVVYLVEHRGLKKQFAAKVLTRDLAENPEARARFEVEARAASQLDHENIINVTDYGIGQDDRPYIVMELLRGRPLDARLAEGTLSLGEIAAIIVPVCNALAEAHAAGIVHRDIKPENVFLVSRPGGRFLVKVVDFGIAKATATTSRITKLGQVLGSPLFMAPEACRGEDVDGRADIYSVGVLLFQLTTGRLPFEDGNVLRVMQMQASKTPPRPRDLAPTLPEALEAVILKALEKEPEDRFQQVEDLANALVAALPPGEGELLRTPAVPPVRTPTPRTPTPKRSTPDAVAQTLMATPDSTSTVVARPVGSSSKPPALAATLTSQEGLPVAPRPAPSRTGLYAVALVALIALVVVLAWPKSRPVAAPVAVSPPVAPPAPVVPEPVAPPPVVAPPPPLPTTVRLRVASEPSGAEVVLAGRVLGTTPLDLAVERADAAQSLELRRAGHKKLVREVSLASDLSLELTLQAERTRRPGPSPEKATPDAGGLEIRGTR